MKLKIGQEAQLNLAMALLVALAAIYFVWPLWRSFLPLEINGNEPWNAHQADVLALGKPLYPAAGGLTTNNYPPLSFYLINFFSRFGDANFVGRILSLTGTIAIGAAVWGLIRQFGGSNFSGALGGIWLIATFSRFFDGYVGMNDPNILALAVMSWGMVWMVSRVRKGLSSTPAIVLMVIAGFIKHNLAAIPIATIYFVASVSRNAAFRALIVGLACVGVGLSLCWALFGDAFFRDLLFPRHYTLSTALGGLGRLQWIAPAIGVTAYWAYQRRESETARFVVPFVIIAFILQFVQKLGSGVADNAQFELTFAAALGLGFAFDDFDNVSLSRRVGLNRAKATVILILVGRLLLSTRLSPYQLIASAEFRVEASERANIVLHESERVAGIAGPVVCSVQTVCRLAGKGYLVDFFFISESIATGRTSAREAENRIMALGAKRVTVDPKTVADWR